MNAPGGTSNRLPSRCVQASSSTPARQERAVRTCLARDRSGGLVLHWRARQRAFISYALVYPWLQRGGVCYSPLSCGAIPGCWQSYWKQHKSEPLRPYLSLLPARISSPVADKQEISSGLPSFQSLSMMCHPSWQAEMACRNHGRSLCLMTRVRRRGLARLRWLQVHEGCWPPAPGNGPSR